MTTATNIPLPTGLFYHNLTALKTYACNGYRYINPLLRGQERPDLWMFDDRGDSAEEYYTEWLHSWLWRMADIPAHVLTEPLTLWRAADHFPDQWTEHGFLSASDNPRFPELYAAMHHTKDTPCDVKRLDLSVGVPVLALSRLLRKNKMDRSETEDEVLIYPGCNMRTEGDTVYITPGKLAGQIIL